MKKFLAAAAVAVALATPAHAKQASFPKEMQGDWCLVPQGVHGKWTYVKEACSEEHRSNLMVITKDVYKVSDGQCRLVSGRRIKYGFIAQMRCEHDGEGFDQRIDFKSVVADIHPDYLEVQWWNNNFGKADDYGSERFSVINQCFIDLAGKSRGMTIDACMAKSGYVFCPDCQVFGNDGPACKDDDPLHSWCWEQNLGRAAEKLRR
jgi:hypothetical protein